MMVAFDSDTFIGTIATLVHYQYLCDQFSLKNSKPLTRMLVGL